MDPKQIALVLTATVDPRAMTHCVRADPATRLADYRRALRFYLDRWPALAKVVLIENSGHPLDALHGEAQRNPHGKRVELISLDCNDYPRQLGKGYGELLLLENGLARSSLAREVTHIAKVTGRLRLMNLHAIVRGVADDTDLCCDKLYAGLYRRLRLMAGRVCDDVFCDSRFVLFSRAYFDARLKGAYHQLDDAQTYYLEHLLHDRVAEDTRNGWRVVPRFCAEPRYRGRSATYDRPYHSAKYRAEHLLKAACRKLDRLSPSRR